jgi:hypothetical protein
MIEWDRGRTCEFTHLLGVPSQAAAEALADELISAGGYAVEIEPAAGDEEGGYPWHVGVWHTLVSSEGGLRHHMDFLADAAHRAGGGVYTQCMEWS